MENVILNTWENRIKDTENSLTTIQKDLYKFQKSILLTSEKVGLLSYTYVYDVQKGSGAYTYNCNPGFYNSFHSSDSINQLKNAIKFMQYNKDFIDNQLEILKEKLKIKELNESH